VISIPQERARFLFLLLISALILLTAQACGSAQAQTGRPEGRSGKLEKDQTWSGTNFLTGDLFIPSGRTLVVQAGSTISLTPGKSLWDASLIDIIVEGTLRLEGGWLSRISVVDLKERKASSWGGIVIINKGKLETRHASIYLADTAVGLYDQSDANVLKTTFKSNLTAVETFHESSLAMEDSTVSANPTGVALYDNTQARIENNWFRFNAAAILIADQSKVQVSGNVLFKNILAISSLDSTHPRIHRNYLIANQTGIRLGQSTAPQINGNWSLFERKRLVDERDLQSETVSR